MSTRRKPLEEVTSSKKPAKASQRPAPEAYEDYDEVASKVVRATQVRAEKVLKKGKWVVIDGDADET